MGAGNVGIVCRVSANPDFNETIYLTATIVHAFTVMYDNDPNLITTFEIFFGFTVHFPSCIEMDCGTPWPYDYKHFSDNLHTTSDFLMWRNLLWRGMPAYFQFCTSVEIRATTHYYAVVYYDCSCQFLDGKTLYKGVTEIRPTFLPVGIAYIFTGKDEEGGLHKPKIVSYLGHNGIDLFTYSRSWVPEDDIIGPWGPI
jgi:hypothetical protein